MRFVLRVAGDSGSFLEFKRGDLIELGEDSADMIQSSGWCYGMCVRSEKKGDFPAECVYILPTMTKPPSDILVLDRFTYSFSLVCTDYYAPASMGRRH